jgi:hypothetical protein
VLNERIIFESVSIYENKFGPGLELVQGAVHGQYRGIQDVVFINFFCRALGHCPGNGLFPDLGFQHKSGFFFQYFGIIQAGEVKIGRQNNRCGQNRTRQGAAAGFIAAGFQKKVG